MSDNGGVPRTFSGMRPGGAVRAGRYKLVEHYERSLIGSGGAYELFDLERDAAERRDLAEAMAEKTAELAAALAAWRERVGAQMPMVNPDHDPYREELERAE